MNADQLTTRHLASSIPIRTELRTLLGVATGLACLAAMIVATLAARHGGPTGSPSIPAEAWRPAWWAGVITSYGLYALGAALLAGAGSERWAVWTALATAVVIQALPLTAPRQLSGDIQTYARQASSAHPYQSNPDGTVYGTLWTVLSRGVNWIGGKGDDTLGHTEIIFRLLAFLSVIVSIAIVAKLASRKTLAIAVLGWNPLVAFHFAGGGHNDAFMMMLVLAGLLAAALGFAQLGGAAWVTSVFVKWSTAPLYVLWAIEQRAERRSAGLVGAAVAAVALVAMSYAAFGSSWLDVVWAIRHTEKIPANFGMVPWLRDLGLSLGHAVTASHLMELAALAVFAFQAARSKLRLGLAAGVIMLVAPRIEPWYAIWPLSLSAVDDEDRWGKVLAVAVTGLLITDAFTPYFDA
jgi:hypothetical protein